MRKKIQELFELQLNKTPDAIAVRFGDKKISYKELGEKSSSLASTILTNASADAIIGISTTRNINMVIGVLAILKAGKAYLPLNTDYPRERLGNIIKDAGLDTCLCTVTEDSLFASLGIGTIHYNFPPNQLHASTPQTDLAYVLYTSGSTGMPKGVGMGHDALVNLLEWQQKNSIAREGTITLQFAPLSFDVSFQEIFATLITGGTLVVVDEYLLLEPQKLLQYIEEQQINRLFLPFVALQYIAAAGVSAELFPACIKEVITAGEQLKITSRLAAFFHKLPRAVLYNQYGPTECHVVTQLKLDGDPLLWPALPTIGRPIDNVTIYILDNKQNEVRKGDIGELCIAGVCLAAGYLNHPDLTAENFINWDHPEKGTMRLYKTGDSARLLADGNIEFLGRMDDQVKISGHRIEPSEIEVVLNAIAHIQQAVVIAREDIAGEKRLVAYLVATEQDKQETAAIKQILEGSLPDYMIPSAYVWLDELPKTPSGKVNKKELPRPQMKRPVLSVLYKAPSGEIEKQIAPLWASVLQLDKVGGDDNFFELGGNSLLALKMAAGIKEQYGYMLPITALYQYPTVSGISSFLNRDGNLKLQQQKKQYRKSADAPIAIIGMAGRFPGADNVAELWEVLKEGRETISFFTKDELDPSIPARLKNDRDYVAARGIINNTDQFDAAFFNVNLKLAELMDPQQRIFLEIAWEVLEVAGCLPGKYDGVVGVYAGEGNNTYYLNNVLGNKDLVDKVGGFRVMMANEKDYVSSRAAFAINLKGPAVSVHSGCSTSLLAIGQAVEAIRTGQCDVAIAGGISITSPVKSGHLYQDGAMLSNDGHCRSFDEDAKGTVFSDGAGVVLLKRIEDAVKDGDTIYAVIKGIGINNDGSEKGLFTAPSSEGQGGAIAMALANAGVPASSISFVEAHGTATPLGDPVEVEGLKIAFGQQDKKQYCAIGSIKSNMGHLTAAAGVAGLIKTTLALHHKKIPASINYTTSNPNIDFKTTPFYVNTELKDWLSNGPRRAGVSCFGVGGTNVHLVLEEYKNEEKASLPGRPAELICWSAKTKKSLDGYSEQLKGYIEARKGTSIADVAYTLHSTRKDFNDRRFIVAASQNELIEKLSTAASADTHKVIEEKISEVIFLFSDGRQPVRHGRELYKQEAVYKNAVDECAALLQELLQVNFKDILYPGNNNGKADNETYTSLIVAVTEYALAKLWISWGIQPSALVGEGRGELLAAHFAGIYELKDCLALIISAVREEKNMHDIHLSPPNIPVVSARTGAWLNDTDATSINYWLEGSGEKSEIEKALITLAEDTGRVILEVGSAQLTNRFSAFNDNLLFVAGFDVEKNGSEYGALLNTLGRMWLSGVEPDWKAFYRDQKRVRLPLPSYVFDRKRYWVDPATIDAPITPGIESVAELSAQNHADRKDIITAKVNEILENASGINSQDISKDMSFIEMGHDSLTLTQVALNLKKYFEVPITFRHLNEEYSNLDTLVGYIDAFLPAESFQPILNNGNTRTHPSLSDLSVAEKAEISKPFGASARIEKTSKGLTAQQKQFINNLTDRYTKKTKNSREYAQKNRAHMADPRVVSGFKPATKDITYPIVVNRSKGSRLWDIDGNEYIDALNGFGSSMLGHQPDVVTKALRQQIDEGYEVGPQHLLAGEVSNLIQQLTGNERVAFCNTGSEAVLGAMRIARTVTGKPLIVSFNGSYHGIIDEVIVRGTSKLKSYPAAPGIMPEAVQNMLVLEYGTEESLKIIKARSKEIAAVLVEPVQSRRPEFFPTEFLHQLREITETTNTALLFDEVITGFRMHPGGIQAMLGITADVVTYGKVVGAGLPIGIIAGKKQYLDALDGGYWQYGDASVPESGVTYFAGTFVRHPLALATSKASLEYMIEKGPSLQEGINAMTKYMADSLNALCTRSGLPCYVAHFGSMWKLKYKEDIPYIELLFTLMREKNIFILEGFPCFLTSAHTRMDVNSIIQKFEESLNEFISGSFYNAVVDKPRQVKMFNDPDIPPVPGAKLGRDAKGNPAWFINDPDRPGKYLQVT